MIKDGYHEHLAMLRERFPERDMVPVTQVAKCLHRDYRNLLRDKTFPVKQQGGRYMVSVVSLARWMC